MIDGKSKSFDPDLRGVKEDRLFQSQRFRGCQTRRLAFGDVAELSTTDDKLGFSGAGAPEA